MGGYLAVPHGADSQVARVFHPTVYKEKRA